MSRVVPVMLVCWFLFSAAHAQETASTTVSKPNFSGTWEADLGRSSALRNRVLEITHNGDQITIDETLEFEKRLYRNKTTLYTDRRGEVNVVVFPGGDFPTEISSKTSWDKDKLVRRSKFESVMETRGERYRVLHNEDQTYVLSRDGLLLTIRTTGRRETPFASNPSAFSGKTTFRRKR